MRVSQPSWEGVIKYESIECDQDSIGILKVVKGVMFKLDGEKELIRAM